ncbi:hypothetical protein LAJ19_20695 (plasmid) [Deinococcus taeanensis]|uniref:hypothetical protein n=1 Tax=Deinococcus taeanensis TaxID=2737050 RepID=UPI001CDB4ADF|nr:hypothetical protein [Deinococcus taeanensis]UBV45224.1 hypothetical protein LAJ19_20695 [Deinococcus taeanensis]
MSWQERLLSVMVGLNGVVLLVTGLSLAVVPDWFYTHLAPFPPFNCHYAGDAGIFSAALGGILLVATPQVRILRPVVAIGTAASLGHALNHMYDHWRDSSLHHHLLHPSHAMKDLSLVLLAGLTLLAVTVAHLRKP